MESLENFFKLKSRIFGGIDIQAGYSNGSNSKLNYMEFHKCSELMVAVTDVIIFLGRVQDVRDNQYETEKSEIFFIPEGVAVEIFSTTLHSLPCHMEPGGFKLIMIQLHGTGTVLEEESFMDNLLHSKNRWIISHPEAGEIVSRESQLGLIGENTEIYLKDRLEI
jgi:hypothetical protein